MATLDDFTPVLSGFAANLPQAVIVIHSLDRVHFLNQAATELFGYDHSEMEGRQLDLLLPGLLNEEHQGHLSNYLGLPGVDAMIQQPFPVQGRHKDGRQFAVTAVVARLDLPGLDASEVGVVTISPVPPPDPLTQHLERAAVASEALVALDVMTDMVIVLDRDLRFLFVNQAALNATPFRKNDVLGKPYWEVLPQVNGTPIDRALRDAFSTQVRTSLEQHSPDSGRWYHFDIMPTESTLVIHCADITAHKTASDSNRQLMRSLDSISDPIIMMDRDWRYSFMNLAAAEFIRRDRDELIGRNIWEMSPWLRDTPFGRACQRAMASGEQFSVEEYYEPRDRWLNVQYLPSTDGFTVHITDITDLKQTHLQLSELLTEDVSRAQMLQVFDLMPTPMLMLDSELRYTYANAAALKSNNRTPADMIGVRMGDVNPAVVGTAFMRYTQEALATGSRRQFEFQLPPNGNWFLIDAIPWNSHVILAAVNITKQKQSEQSIGILTTTLEQALDDGWDRPSARDTGKHRGP
jgi:PAS domain S-box-containing protein